MSLSPGPRGDSSASLLSVNILPVRTCCPLPSLCALSLPVFELGVFGIGSNCGREGLGWQQQELVISGFGTWRRFTAWTCLDAGWKSPSSSPGLPSGQGCARKPPKGEIFWYFLLSCLCCLERLWVWRTVLVPAFSDLRLGQGDIGAGTTGRLGREELYRSGLLLKPHPVFSPLPSAACSGDYMEPEKPGAPLLPPPPQNSVPHYAEADIVTLQGVTGGNTYAVPALPPGAVGDGPPRVDFPRSRLRFKEKLGEGQFGEVRRMPVQLRQR